MWITQTSEHGMMAGEIKAKYVSIQIIYYNVSPI